MQQLLFLFLLFFIAAYWIDCVRVKELARHAGKMYCREYDVQFLDNTVTKRKTRIRLSSSSIIEIQRSYTFDYSDDGEQRHSGIILMHGKRMHEIQMNMNTYDHQA